MQPDRARTLHALVEVAVHRFPDIAAKLVDGIALRVDAVSERADFTIGEIMAQAEAENATGSAPIRPGVKVHAYLHCVANKPPNPGRYRMLFETAGGRRRLFRRGDPCHPLRTAKDAPRRHEIPARYRHLIDWYVGEYRSGTPDDAEDPVLALRGLGREIWADEDADAYVRRQRADWQ